MVQLINGDCLVEMKSIPDKSIDMILCDLPYGSTACSWDIIIPFDKLWEQYNRIIKDNGAIALFGSEPFSSQLRMSNLKNYKYDWIWDKTFGRQPQLANIQPMKQHEIISIFEKNGKKVHYYPQREKLDKPYFSSGAGNNAGTKNDHKLGLKKLAKVYTEKTPTTILKYKPVPNGKNLHPTQKPVALMEYLIKTYTNEGETVLDNTFGSCSTGVACVNTNRNFIGIEMDNNYFSIGVERIKKHEKVLDNTHILSIVK